MSTDNDNNDNDPNEEGITEEERQRRLQLLKTERDTALQEMNEAFDNAALLAEFDLPTTGELLMINGGRFTIESNKYREEIAGDFHLHAFEKGEIIQGKKTATYDGAVTRVIADQMLGLPSMRPPLKHGLTQSAQNLTITVDGKYERTFLDQMWENASFFSETVLGASNEVRGAAAVTTALLRTSCTFGPVVRAANTVITLGTFDFEFGIAEAWTAAFWYEKIGILIHQPLTWINNFANEQSSWETIKTTSLAGGQVLQF